MSILVGRQTRLLVQGITGREGAFHTGAMIEYGTQVVAGVTPGKGGQSVHGVPVFDTVRQAAYATNPNTSIIYVPAAHAADAILEAVDAGIGVIVCVTEGIPTLDMIPIVHQVRKQGAQLIGPNCPGVISPGEAKVGIMPGHIYTPGRIGVVSRSGTLTYEVVSALSAHGLGQSTVVGIGGDPVIGTTFVDALRLFEGDTGTDCVLLLGEIGGTDEEQAAEFITREIRKPVVAFVAGQTAPPGKRMGHAGAIISGGTGSAAEKISAFRASGVPVATQPDDIVSLLPVT